MSYFIIQLAYQNVITHTANILAKNTELHATQELKKGQEEVE